MLVSGRGDAAGDVELVGLPSAVVGTDTVSVCSKPADFPQVIIVTTFTIHD